MFCYALIYVHSRFASILNGKRELIDLLSLSSWCLVIVWWLFLAVKWVCLHVHDVGDEYICISKYHGSFYLMVSKTK